MKQQIKTKQFAIQYWLNELPELCETESSLLCKTIQAQTVQQYSKIQKIGVELYLAKDAGNYGMLGVEFLPFENNGTCNIEIVYTTTQTISYQSSINRFDQRIFCGLIPEYAQDLQQTIAETLLKQQLAFEGAVKVTCAANSEVGSSKTIYRILFELILFLRKSYKENCFVNPKLLGDEVLRVYACHTSKKIKTL